MVEDRVQRRLAAILAADVVGYSRLTEIDEEGTHARLKTHRTEFIEPTVKEHQGRIVKLMGDGVLVDFPSAIEAVRCALQIQRGMAEREADLPTDIRISFRIGINVGDTIIEDEDIFGGGVNIAARLEALADPGGIWISGTAYDQVEGMPDCGFEFVGERKVKNIERPVRVFKVLLNQKSSRRTVIRDLSQRPRWKWAAAAAAIAFVVASGLAGWLKPWMSSEDTSSIGGERLELPSKPSIAVLPFTNLSNDPERDYFVDGITNDIITDLSKFSSLFVIAANSTFQYKDKSVPAQDVARDLGVRYVLDGSIQQVGNSLRINAQLIDATSGAHIWAEHYDRDASDLFAAQREITQNIVGTIGTIQGGALLQAEIERLSRQPTASLRAYDHYLRGIYHKQLETKEDNEFARQLFEQAIELDSNFAQAVAELSSIYLRDVGGDWTDTREADLARAEELARQAIAIDPTEPAGYIALSYFYNLQAQNDQAIPILKKAETLNPNAYSIKRFLGYLLAYDGSPEEGLLYLEAARRLNPLHGENTLRSIAQALFFARRYEDAIATLNNITRRHRTSYWLYLAASHAQLGQMREARAAIDEALRLKSSLTLEGEIERRRKNGLAPALADHLHDSLRKAGLPSKAT